MDNQTNQLDFPMKQANRPVHHHKKYFPFVYGKFFICNFLAVRLVFDSAMEAVEKVTSEVDKVITKFTAISDHSSKLIANEITSLELLRATLLERKYAKVFAILISRVKED